MKRNLTVVCILVGLCVALFAAVTALGFVFDLLPVGIVGAIMTFIALWVLAGSIYREQLYDRVVARYEVADYAAARAMLSAAEHNHLLFPIARIIVYQLYVKVAMAQDDTVTAERYISRLRHNGGDGWKYRTAFFIVLLNLDWGDVAAATAEYTAFKTACVHSSLYRPGIDVLDAIFANINGEAHPLPESVKQSKYPILHRVVAKYCP